MLRRTACALGALMVGASAASCGPPPPPLGGTINYSDQCVGGPGNTGVVCSGLVQEGPNGETNGSTHKIFACSIATTSSGTALSFRMGTANDAALSTPQLGMTGCGTVSGPGALLTGGTMQLYFSNGSQAANVPLTGGDGTCQVTITAVTPDGNSPGFAGHVRCANVMDNGAPAVTHTITGVNDITPDPMAGEFEFHTCSTNVLPCR